MKSNLLGLVVLSVCMSSLSANASTFAGSDAVTGSASPGTATQVTFNIPSNWSFSIIGVLPVVASVVSNPASMAAAIDVTGSVFAGYGQIYAAQWTITAGASGIETIPAYQALAPFNLLNNSASSTTIRLRCSVGGMTGSCIFVTKMTRSGDPLF